MAQAVVELAHFITRVSRWTGRLLDEGGWVRRGFLGLSVIATWKTMLWCFDYATASALAGRAGIDTAAVIGAVSAVPGALVTFAFKWYLESRGPASIA